MSEFCAITTVYNPVHYSSRFRLHEEFRERMKQSEVSLYTVELAGTNQPFQVTDKNDPFSIQLRSDHEIWHKENLINIALQKIPRQ